MTAGSAKLACIWKTRWNFSSEWQKTGKNQTNVLATQDVTFRLELLVDNSRVYVHLELKRNSLVNNCFEVSVANNGNNSEMRQNLYLTKTWHVNWILCDVKTAQTNGGQLWTEFKTNVAPTGHGINLIDRNVFANNRVYSGQTPTLNIYYPRFW